MEKQTRESGQPDLHAIVFKMAGHDYVVDVALAQEIIRVDGTAHIDGAPSYVEGVLKRRGRIIPIVDLRKRLELRIGPPTVETCAIVVNLPVGPVGFLVDGVSELIWIEPDEFEPPSPVIFGGESKLDAAYVRGVAYLNGRALVMLNLERLLTAGEQRALPNIGEREVESLPSAARGQAMRRLLLFELGGELYGVEAVAVAEIREPPPVTPLPNTPPEVRGLVNLRGAILPVLDLRRKFSFERATNGPEARLVILKGGIALWVDRVSGLARLPLADFQPAPPGVARIGAEYYAQVAMLEGRMLIELDIRALLADAGA